MNATLLIELLTEELPPKALSRLGETFAQQVHAGLSGHALVPADGACAWFATPRRLAVRVPGVLAVAPDATAFEKIMPVAVALDAAGQPTPALKKKLEGYTLTETRTFYVPDKSNSEKLVLKSRTVRQKEYAPDTHAIKLVLLQNEAKEEKEAEAAKKAN